MTNYIKVNSDSSIVYPYTFAALRRDNSNTSFPKEPSTDLLESFGVYTVTIAPDPENDLPSKKIELSTEPTLIGEVWTLTKTIVDLTTEEAEEKYTRASVTTREKRDELLSRTDWMGLSDVTMSDGWATYRQALRDVPEQAGFPDNVTWPTKPE